MPRESIAMTVPEQRDFFARQRWMLLVTLTAAGDPQADLTPSALDGDRIYLAIPGDGESAENLRRDPRMCCASDEYPTYYEIKGATAHGRATRVDDPALRDRLGWSDPGLAVFAVDLEDVVSFDFSKIEKKY